MSRRVLFVVNNASFFISHRLPIAIECIARSYQVGLAAPYDPEAAAILKKAKIEYFPISLSRSGTNPIGEGLCIISLIKLFKKLKPDLVHLVTIKPVIYGGFAARITKVPAVVSAISGMGYVFTARGLERVLRGFVRVLYRFALGHPNSKVIFQNPDDRAAFEDFGIMIPDKTVLIRGSGVDTSTFTPRAKNEGVFTVLMASRLLWDKGVREFIQAAEIFKSQGLLAKFVLVGACDEGNPFSVPKGVVETWKLRGLIEWLGHRSDMPNVLSQCDVFVLPSYREGLPRALIEAASCGLPIVTTDSPGCREVVQEGVNGFLVPPRSGEGVANALLKLYGNPTLRKKMGIAGRAMAEHEFTVQQVVERTLGIYQELKHGMEASR